MEVILPLVITVSCFVLSIAAIILVLLVKHFGLQEPLQYYQARIRIIIKKSKVLPWYCCKL